MSAEEIVFFVLAVPALGGGILVAAARGATRQRAGYFVAASAVAGLHVLLSAPIVGMVLLAGAAVVVAAVSPARGVAEREGVGKLAGVGIAAGGLMLAFVLVGTLARQYISYGADLDDRPGFGGLGLLAADLTGRHAVAVQAAGLALLAAVIGLALAGSRARGQERAGE